MKKLLFLLIVFTMMSCEKKQNIRGKYTAQDESALFESIEFDGKVATFGSGLIGKYMPAYNYEVKDDMLYIETHEGILTFKIIDNNTIKGMVSIVKGSVYKKQK